MRQQRIIEHSLREGSRATTEILFSIRWIGENKIEQFARLGQLRNRGEDILDAHLQRCRREAGEREVLPEYLRIFGRFLDADGGNRSPAEAFQTKRARAREQLQYARVLRAAAEAVEDRLLNQVRRGADLQAF